MKTTLDDSTIPDDIKAKQHRQNLSRLLRAKCKLTEEPLDDLMPTVDKILEIKPKPQEEKPKVKTQKSTRVRKTLQRYDWEEW